MFDNYFTGSWRKLPSKYTYNGDAVWAFEDYDNNIYSYASNYNGYDANWYDTPMEYYWDFSSAANQSGYAYISDGSGTVDVKDGLSTVVGDQ